MARSLFALVFCLVWIPADSIASVIRNPYRLAQATAPASGAAATAPASGRLSPSASAVHAGHQAKFSTRLNPRASFKALSNESGLQRVNAGLYAPVSSRQMEILQANRILSDRERKSAEMNGTRTFPGHITSLKDLEGSEYVGPIGVGTVYENCGEASLMRATKSENSDDSCGTRHESELSVVFDTGSTNLWMSSDLCGYPCNAVGRHRYNHRASVSFQEPDPPVLLNIDFGTANLKGPMGIDDFHIGPFTIKNQHFGMIQQANGDTFASLALEGIVGLGFPSMAADNQVPFFDNVIHQKALEHNEFAFFFNNNVEGGNGILWGGVDPKLFDGPITMVRVTQPYYWATDLLDFLIDDESMTVSSSSLLEDSSVASESQGLGHLLREGRVAPSNSPKLIVDSGTTYFTASDPLYSMIKEKLPDKRCSETSRYPTLRFKINDAAGNDLVLNFEAKDYMVSEYGDICRAAFMKLDVAEEYGPAMLFGEIAMRKYFTVFDRGDGNPQNARMGFALAKQDVNLVQATSSFTDVPKTSLRESLRGANTAY